MKQQVFTGLCAAFACVSQSVAAVIRGATPLVMSLVSDTEEDCNQDLPQAQNLKKVTIFNVSYPL